jgi:hypothetical protein
MNLFKIALLASTVVLATPALAQDINSTSGSNAGANSGSTSGAASNSNQGQSQNANNAGIGNSTSGSTSGADANSSTASQSASFGNQQRQNASSNQGQSQTQGQTASNMQGTQVSNTFNSSQLKRTYVGTNNAIPLVASSSFSSDYCGGTVSGGVSTAPIGLSIGASAPKMDWSCQALRRAEKFGMIAANWHNLGYDERARKDMLLMEWAVCTSDSKGPKMDRPTEQACEQVLTGSTPTAMPEAPPPPVTPQVEQKTIEDTGQHDAPVMGANDYAGVSANHAAAAATSAMATLRNP